MAMSVQEIVTSIGKRRDRLRAWAAPDSHARVVAEVREAWAALGAMAEIVAEAGSVLTRALVGAIAEEQRLQDERHAQALAGREEAERLRDEAAAAPDEETAEWLREAAARRERPIGRPDMSEVWAAGVLLTAGKLYRSAELVAGARDAQAIRTLGLKSLTTAGKWALKLTPLRAEDLQDFVDAWKALKDLTEPLDDATAVLEAGRLRAGQAKAASSLFERLEVIRETADAWSRMALREPFLAEALGIAGADAEAALAARSARMRDGWA